MPPIRRAALAAAIFAVLPAVAALARSSGPTLQDREDHACYADAQRLCGQFVPDVAKITTCMERRKAEVSPACAVFFRKDAR